MNKRRFVFLLLAYFCLMTNAMALPDKEKVQSVLKKTDVAVKQGLVVYEDAQTVKRELTDKVNGVKGAINTAKNMSDAVKNGDLDGALSAGESLLDQGGISLNSKEKKLKVSVPSFVNNINDVEETQKDLDKAFNAQMGNGNNNAVAEEQDDKMQAVQRENIASLYARALYRRVLIGEEKAADPKEIDTSDTRRISKAIAEMRLETIMRLKRVLDFESGIYEFRLTEKNRSFQDRGSGGTE